MKLPLLSIDGAKSDTIEVSDKLVKLKVNHKLIKFVIDWQLNHAKPRTAKTKQRNQIKGSTKKIIAQKGSGGARHASKKAPIFIGGGIAHGPKGSVYKIKKINKSDRFHNASFEKRLGKSSKKPPTMGMLTQHSISDYYSKCPYTAEANF